MYLNIYSGLTLKGEEVALLLRKTKILWYKYTDVLPLKQLKLAKRLGKITG
jgi:hypothetical protein